MSFKAQPAHVYGIEMDHYLLRLIMAIGIVVSILAISACGDENRNSNRVNGTSQDEDGSGPTGRASGDVSESATTVHIPVIVNPDDVAAETFDLPSLTDNLSRLDNYRVDFSANFNGENSSGEKIKWRIESEQWISREPPAMRLDLENSGFPGPLDSEILSLVKVQTGSYLAIPSLGCVSTDIDSPELVQTVNLAKDIVADLKGARIAPPHEPVNSIPSLHYYFDEEAKTEWRDQDLSIDGHLYIAEDDGHVTRISIEAVGTGQLFPWGESESGILELTIDVLDDPASFPIEVPEACSQSDLYPLVDDAFQISTIGELLSYQTRLSPADVLVFYEQAMPAAGWSPSEEAVLLDEGAFLAYEKEGMVVTISLEINDGEGTVTVLITP